MLSPYFEELYKSYCAELEDLETDSEGKNVLSKRLSEKRLQFSALLPMIEFAPEMVAPVFRGSISFHDPHAIALLSFAEPEDFPAWEVLEPTVEFASWIQKELSLVLLEPHGEQFILSVICLEFLYEKDRGQGSHPVSRPEEEDDNAENIDGDLDEAGADWLAEQGFDRRG